MVICSSTSTLCFDLKNICPHALASLNRDFSRFKLRSGIFWFVCPCSLKSQGVVFELHVEQLAFCVRRTYAAKVLLCVLKRMCYVLYVCYLFA